MDWITITGFFMMWLLTSFVITNQTKQIQLLRKRVYDLQFEVIRIGLEKEKEKGEL